MITIRPDEARGRSEHGWLDSRHTFSFADYHDPRHMGFRSLRVINEDRVQPGRGFGTHSHRDMEIISYVLDGRLEHKDNLGNGSTIGPHEVQRMSAGRGVSHSEFNPSRSELVHFLQIWIQPATLGLPASYEQRAFDAADARGRLQLVGAPDGHDGTVTIHQDVLLFVSILGDGERARYEPAPGRHLWVQVARGALTLNGRELAAGDGAALSDERALELVGLGAGAESLVFDLA